MAKFPTKTVLAALREIGWRTWDPIGIADDREFCETEYDSYLLVAFDMCARGVVIAEVAQYLEMIETEHMGLKRSPNATSSALATASKIDLLSAEFRTQQLS